MIIINNMTNSQRRINFVKGFIMPVTLTYIVPENMVQISFLVLDVYLYLHDCNRKAEQGKEQPPFQHIFDPQMCSECFWLKLSETDSIDNRQSEIAIRFSVLARRQKNRLPALVFILGDTGFPLRFPTRLSSHSHRFSFVGKDE